MLVSDLQITTASRAPGLGREQLRVGTGAATRRIPALPALAAAVAIFAASAPFPVQSQSQVPTPTPSPNAAAGADADANGNPGALSATADPPAPQIAASGTGATGSGDSNASGRSQGAGAPSSEGPAPFKIEGSLSAPGADPELVAALEGAAFVLGPSEAEFTDSQEILAAALANYRSLLRVLYDRGRFGPDISIRIDGREATDIIARDLGARVERVEVTVAPGPVYAFGRVEVSPLAPEAGTPEILATGADATTRKIRSGVQEAIEAWREAGHAKARVADQEITAQHSDRTLDVGIFLDPGPALTFGEMRIAGSEGVRDQAVRSIAGFPAGEPYSPAKLGAAAARLRRTGAFSVATLTAADEANEDGSLDFDLKLVDQKKRRASLGMEFSSLTGVDLTAGWIHRNAFGAAERLLLEGRIRNIRGLDEIDGLFNARFEEPSKLGASATRVSVGGLDIESEPFYDLRSTRVGIGLRRDMSDDLYVEAIATPTFGVADDGFGSDRAFDYVLLPIRAEYDRRDNVLDPASGHLILGSLTPMFGLGSTRSAFGALVDARAFFGLAGERIVLSGRTRLGTTFGANIDEISPQFLHFSGGAGTVRGQPYEELGVQGPNGTVGGRSTVVANAEIRSRVSEKVSLVAFYDYGSVGAEQFIAVGASPHHSGVGTGMRYLVSGLGSIRADFAWPKLGETGSGAQFYLGIGQAF